jgi:hypothetical protein
MAKLGGLLFLTLVMLLLGGGAFLAVWDIPPPISTIEQTLPDDRFPR